VRHALRPMLTGLVPRLPSQRVVVHMFHRPSGQDKIGVFLPHQPRGTSPNRRSGYLRGCSSILSDRSPTIRANYRPMWRRRTDTGDLLT